MISTDPAQIRVPDLLESVVFRNMLEAYEAGNRGAPCMSSIFLNDPQHWRDRSDQMRSQASETADPESRAIMLRLANDFELLARRVERRAKDLAQEKN